MSSGTVHASVHMKLAFLCYTFFIHPHSSSTSYSHLLHLPLSPPSLFLLHSSSFTLPPPMVSSLPIPLSPPSSLLLFSSPSFPHSLPLFSYQGKSVPVLCLEGFSQLLQTVSTRYPHKMETFLTSVNPTTEENTSRNDRVHFFVRHFQVKWREVASFPGHTHTTGQVLGMCLI